MMNILVVEDDELQRKNLINMIKESKKNIIYFEAESEKEALTIADESSIDIFYIDISLKDSSGLNLAYKLRDEAKYRLSWIIFVTTSKQHMLSAFKKVHCYDYLIKPYSKEKVLELTKNLLNNINNKLEAKPIENEYVTLDSNKISFKIYLKDIYFIEVRIRNIIVHTVDGQYEINRMPLKTIIDKLCDNNYIVQAHRSYVINLKKIKRIEKESSSSWIVYFEGYKEPAFIGSKYKDKVDEYLYDMGQK